MTERAPLMDAADDRQQECHDRTTRWPTADRHALELFRLLALSAAIGIAGGAAGWLFVLATSLLKEGVYTALPHRLGFDGAPIWWPLPVVAAAALVMALVIFRAPGGGGKHPIGGLQHSDTHPSHLPGIFVAGLVTVGLGPVLGPQASLIDVGSAVGVLVHDLLGGHTSEDVRIVAASAGSAAALSFIFGAPLFGAIVVIEGAALQRKRFTSVLPTALVATTVGSLVANALTSASGRGPTWLSLGALSLPHFSRASLLDVLWAAPLALAVAVVVHVIFQIAQRLHRLVDRQPYVLYPAAGVAIAGLGMAFAAATGRPVTDGLFSGQSALPDLLDPDEWSRSDLAWVVLTKSLNWGVSLSCFRDGPMFPGLFLGTASGALAAGMFGFSLTPAVAVGMGAAIVSAVRLPATAIVFATLLVAPGGGFGAGPLVFVGVIAAFAATLALSRLMPYNVEEDDNASILPRDIVQSLPEPRGGRTWNDESAPLV